MVTLNLDCWRIVFDQLEPETRALYNCLFVSKEFFSLSTRVLYRRPLEVFEGQLEFSSFSIAKLGKLLSICSGFTTPAFSPYAPSPSVTTSTSTRGMAGEGGKKPRSQQQPSSSPSSSSSAAAAATTATVAAAQAESTTKNSASSTLTTINYYKLVTEYPKSFAIRSELIPWWQDYLGCFIETIPILTINAQHLDFILALVSKLGTLHTITIEPPPAQTTETAMTFGPVYLEKLIQLIQSHQRFFPGKLKEVKESFLWKEWKEVLKVQEQMGGMEKMLIVMKPDLQIGQDLSQLIVTRLKELILVCHEGFETMSGGRGKLKVVEVLKGCRGLKKLDLSLPMNTKMNWSVLTEVGGGGGGGDGENKMAHRTVAGLKHLIVRASATLTVQVMKIFKETLETVKIVWRDNESFQDSFFGWENEFLVPNLKSIELLDRFCFFTENLISCPKLESLILGNATCQQSPLWPTLLTPTTSTLPVTLRKLYLSNTAAAQFDLLSLKWLRNLDFLHLSIHDDQQYKNLPLIDMSIGWYFPFLKKVVLSGRFAIQIQGQILWISPRLEYLNLSLWLIGARGVLDTDTFLFPPSELDCGWRFPSNRDDGSGSGSGVISRKNDYLVGNINAIPTTVPLPLVSTACFPVLKELWLQSFEVLKFENVEEFGKVFFGPRLSSIIIDTTGYNKTTTATATRSTEMIDNQEFLFPNLEHLEFFWDKTWDYVKFQPLVLIAMQSLPKLELVHYFGQYEPWRHDQLNSWLEKVPGENGLGVMDKEYRNRPLTTFMIKAREEEEQEQKNGGGGGEGRRRKEKGEHMARVNRCVVEFEKNGRNRYQLKTPKPSSLKETKVKATKFWKQSLRFLKKV